MEEQQRTLLPLPVFKITARKPPDGTIHTIQKEKVEIETEPTNKQTFFNFIEE